jgi:pseudouridine-5'-phosphate glycosidase
VSILGLLDVQSEVAIAAREHQPVVALESTLIAHGLPWPLNLETAREAEAIVRAEGAVPATIAVWQGKPTVGLNGQQIEELARRKDVIKASRRDLAAAVAQGRTAATTVAATMFLAHRAGIRVFATGGIGGVHRGEVWDVSADLFELSRTPVAVVCAGAKSILDLRRTLEVLESLAVPVLGYSTETFPAFYVRDSGEPVSARADSPAQAAVVLRAHWALEGAGAVLAQAVDANQALSADEMEKALRWAESEAANAKIRGNALTPFLLEHLATATGGKTLQANRALVLANARLAAQVAKALSGAAASA